jgi:hypothetical protein
LQGFFYVRAQAFKTMGCGIGIWLQNAIVDDDRKPAECLNIAE